MKSLIDSARQAVESLEGIVNSNWRNWEEFASVEEFERWAKSRANHTANNLRQAIEQAQKEAALDGLAETSKEIEQEPVARKYSIEPHGNGYAIYYGRTLYHHGANIGHLTEVTPATIKLIQDALNASPSPQAEKQDADEWYEKALWGEKQLHSNQQPIAYVAGYYGGQCVVNPLSTAAVLPTGMALYAAPPRKEWVGLTDNEIIALTESNDIWDIWVALNVQSKLKERNGGC